MAKKKPAKKTASKPRPAKSKAVRKPAPRAKAKSKPAKSKPASKSKPAAKAKPAKAQTKGQTKAKAEVKAPVKPADQSKNSGRKGITIVSNKPSKKAKPKQSVLSNVPAMSAHLMKPGSSKPLIPSGPSAPAGRTLGGPARAAESAPAPTKTPFGKRELAHFREILVRKRAEIIGDVSSIEAEALTGQSGSLSRLPQHIAEQGSEAYDQSLALEIAASDRRLLKEIDDAIARIDQGTYGVCELTGKPIKQERLEQLPWARYSIEAARELERRSMHP